MGRDQVMALCDQRIQHLTDTNAGHVISFSLRANTRYPVASG
jgi:hypothetical protein